MDIDWDMVISNTIGGMIFSAAGIFLTSVWLFIRKKIKKRPTFSVTRSDSGEYRLKKLRRGIIQDLTFTTGGNGLNTSPNHEPEVPISGDPPERKGESVILPIEPGRDVDKIFLSWHEDNKRGGHAKFEKDTATVFTNKLPRGAWKRRFQ